MTTQTEPLDKKLLQEMLEKACHFGHRTSKWNPKMQRYIYGQQENVHIIDLTKTYEKLVEALSFITDQVSKGKTILLVCTKLQARRFIEEAGQKTGMPYVNEKWIPGLLTNYATIRQRIRYLKELKEKQTSGELAKYTKKEIAKFRQVIEKLERALGGVQEMLKLPDILFVCDGVRDKNALKEANRLKIPCIGVVDTNADPDLFAYPIPGNDDSIKSLGFFITKVTDAILEGKKGVATTPKT